MTTQREEPCRPIVLPPAMADALAGYQWARDTIGESGGAVYRLHGKPGAPDLFLKHGTGRIADDITDEMARLRWLAAHLPVPTITHFTATGDAAWLLMTALPGKTAYQILEAHPEERDTVVAALACFLRRLHAIPTAACPLTSDHPHRLALARSRIDAGLVEEDDFDDDRQGWTAEQVWDTLHTLLPFAPDPVVTHGDFSLNNLLIANGDVTGCIDVGRVGIADRYQDLAILWNCLDEFDPALQQHFLDLYGIAALDRRKLDFHLMLDELF